MANIYKNAFYAPTTTAAVVLYTCPSNANAIIQNIQITNESGSKVVVSKVFDHLTSTNYQIAYASITGPTICNLAKGPIVLKENDNISLATTVTAGISGTLAILEINRDDQNGQ
jgi:hypothetical protein